MKAVLGLLHHFIRVVRFVTPHLIYASAFFCVGVYASFCHTQMVKYEQMAVATKAKYEAQRTADMVGLLKSTKPDLGCPVEEVRMPLKKGRSKKVCG